MNPRSRSTALLLALSSSALAQEATNTPAATQPAQGRFYLRQKFQVVSLRRDPSPAAREIDKITSTTSLTYGLDRDKSLTLDLPITHATTTSAGADTRDLGLDDFSITFKYRPWQHDLGSVDSLRLAFFAGLEFPSGDSGFSSRSLDPFVGGVFTAILGRHGINQALSYKFNDGGERFSTRPGDGPDDAFRYDTAYLFRLDPPEYSPETTAATYLTLELNGLYETGGDNEVLLGPGILYEARGYALEATVGFPVITDVRDRPEREVVVTFGFRVLF